MKAEKCPHCEQVPTFYPSQYSDVTPQTVIKCGCGTEFHWGSAFWAKLYFNRWARRERKEEVRK